MSDTSAVLVHRTYSIHFVVGNIGGVRNEIVELHILTAASPAASMKVAMNIIL